MMDKQASQATEHFPQAIENHSAVSISNEALQDQRWLSTCGTADDRETQKAPVGRLRQQCRALMNRGYRPVKAHYQAVPTIRLRI